MDYGGNSTGFVYDITGFGAFLWRSRARPKRVVCPHAMFCHCLFDVHPMAGRRLFYRIWGWQRLLGGLGKMFLKDVTPDSLFGTIPEILFFAFQMTFAIITPALIVGAYVERISFAFVLTFSGLWMLLVYAPVTHWIWGGGLLAGADTGHYLQTV